MKRNLSLYLTGGKTFKPWSRLLLFTLRFRNDSPSSTTFSVRYEVDAVRMLRWRYSHWDRPGTGVTHADLPPPISPLPLVTKTGTIHFYAMSQQINDIA